MCHHFVWCASAIANEAFLEGYDGVGADRADDLFSFPIARSVEGFESGFFSAPNYLSYASLRVVKLDQAQVI